MTQAGNNVENVENNWEKFVNLESLLNMGINGDFMKTGTVWKNNAFIGSSNNLDNFYKFEFIWIHGILRLGIEKASESPSLEGVKLRAST